MMQNRSLIENYDKKGFLPYDLLLKVDLKHMNQEAGNNVVEACSSALESWAVPPMQGQQR